MAAGQMGDKKPLSLASKILMQSMFAAENIRAQRDRLLEFQIQLNQTPRDAPEGHLIERVVSGLAEVCVDGLNAAARYLNICLYVVTNDRARLAPNTSSSSDEKQLIDALVAALRLPAPPTTLTDAFPRIQAALDAVKLLQDYFLPRCTDHLTRPISSSSMDKARIQLLRACALVNLAVNHIDLAVAASSPLVHPKEIAINAHFADFYTDFGWACSCYVRKIGSRRIIGILPRPGVI